MPARGKHPHNRLTALIVRGARPGRHSDGQGLYLHVRSTGARQWMQRLVIQGHRYDLGLGSFDFVSLADARRVALENRRIARAGGDPRAEPTPTFRRVYEVATEMRRKGWDRKATEASWRRGFEKYALPAIGDKPVDTITVADLRAIVLPHWNGLPSSKSIGSTIRLLLSSGSCQRSGRFRTTW